MSRTLHVLQGDSAAGCFRQALHPERGSLLVNQDVLSCGPLPAFESAEQWTRLRGEYWDSVAWDGQAPSTFNGDFLHRISSVDESDSLVFWMGTGVAEQLMLVWSMHLLRLVRSRAKVSVVQFTRVGPIPSYGLAPDDKHFLMVREGESTQQSELIVAENWLETLRGK